MSSDSELAAPANPACPPPGQPRSHTASRLKYPQAAIQTVIRDGLEQQQQASRLADRITAERDNLDGAPSAADIRRGIG
jgi:hypothetical protein